MTRPRLSRRALLRGAGGAAIGLPFLSAMLPARRTVAQTGEIPKRFVVMFTANGTIAERWRPSGGGRDFALSEILSPLEPHKSDIVVLEGIDMVTAIENAGGGNGHDVGMGHMLVARRLMEGPSGVGEFGHLWDGSAGGISVDQEAARTLGEGTRFRSLEFGVNSGIRQQIPSFMSWGGPFEPLPRMNEPGPAFDRIFGDGVTDPARLEQLKLQRRSVLDAVLGEYHRLDGMLGPDDRRRLDAHMTAIREVETRIEALDAATQCVLPMREAPSAFDQVGRVHMDMMVMAMACELSPVNTLQWGNAQAGNRFPWLGIDRGHHDLSHDGDSVSSTIDMITRINQWYAQQFAYLITRMKEVTEADGGSLLDHSVLLWCNELGRGNSHTRRDIPYVLAGSASGAIETGRFLSYTNEPHGNLFVSLLNALDIPATTFGDPDYCTGPLTGLLA